MSFGNLNIFSFCYWQHLSGCVVIVISRLFIYDGGLSLICRVVFPAGCVFHVQGIDPMLKLFKQKQNREIFLLHLIAKCGDKSEIN